MTFVANLTVPKSLPLALALIMGFGVAGFAQETTAPAAEAPVTEVPADTATPSDLSMGTEVDAAGAPAADGIGSSYVQASFDAWEQRCVKTEDGSDPCQLYQLLKDAQGNAVAEFSMFNLPAGGEAAAGATIIVPLETLLTENLLLAVDGSKPKIYPFTFCSTIGCVARVGFTGGEVDQFRKGAKATVTIVPVVAPDQKVVVDLSLKGFTAGFEAVSKTNP